MAWHSWLPVFSIALTLVLIDLDGMGTMEGKGEGERNGEGGQNRLSSRYLGSLI